MELANAIESEILKGGENYDDASSISSDYPELHKAAIRWGEYCLRTFDGKALRKALEISVSIAEFTAYMDKLSEKARGA